VSSVRAAHSTTPAHASHAHTMLLDDLHRSRHARVPRAWGIGRDRDGGGGGVDLSVSKRLTTSGERIELGGGEGYGRGKGGLCSPPLLRLLHVSFKRQVETVVAEGLHVGRVEAKRAVAQACVKCRCVCVCVCE